MVTKNITPKSTIKSWFKRGLKPLEVQFHAWMDSYWHKEEKIPTSTIDGLEEILNNKAESSGLDDLIDDLNTHKLDDVRHKTDEEQQKLNNLADDPNLTYATKEELEAQGAIIIPVDFTKTDIESDAEIKAYLQPFVEDGTFFTKPVFAHYMWKSSYEEGAADVMEYSFILPGTPFVSGPANKGYSFNYPLDILDINDPDNTNKYNIQIYMRGSRLAVNFTSYNPDPYDKTFFVVDDDDGFLIGDRDSGMKIYDLEWNNFYNSLKKGFTPGLYLKSNNTDVFVPASYYLAENENAFDGVIRIQYIKDGHICIEDRKFAKNNNGGFCGKGSCVSSDSGGLQKIPLDGWAKMYVLKCTVAGDQSATATNPEIMEAYAAAHAAGKSPLLVLSLMDFVYCYPTMQVVQGNVISVQFDSHSINAHSIANDSHEDLAVSKYTVNARKTDSVWTVQVENTNTILKICDYMKVSNIHVVTEYPADLSAYPDGSIFIKQEAVS